MNSHPLRPFRYSLVAAAVLLSLGFARETSDVSDEAMRIHREALVVDGHNDLPWRLREVGDLGLEKHDLKQPQPKFHTDIPRLRAGGVGAQFWSAYVPVELESSVAVKTTFEQIDAIRRMVARYPDTFEMAGNYADIERIRAAGKIASLIGVEGGHSIGNSLETLRQMHALGARYLTLTHWKNTDWADAATDREQHGGLTAFGEEVVRELNRLGMFIDISHVSVKTMKHALRITKAPVIASHSSAYALKKHVRNVPDDVLKLVAKNGGVVMVNFYTGFIADSAEDAHASTHWSTERPPVLNAHACPEHSAELDLWSREGRFPRADVATLVDHIEHIAKVAGVDHVGLGSDFDGVPYLPQGLEDVSKYPAITEELLRRGFSEADIKKVLGANLMRAYAAMEQASRDLH